MHIPGASTVDTMGRAYAKGQRGGRVVRWRTVHVAKRVDWAVRRRRRAQARHLRHTHTHTHTPESYSWNPKFPLQTEDFLVLDSAFENRVGSSCRILYMNFSGGTSMPHRYARDNRNRAGVRHTCAVPCWSRGFRPSAVTVTFERQRFSGMNLAPSTYLGAGSAQYTIFHLDAPLIC